MEHCRGTLDKRVFRYLRIYPGDQTAESDHFGYDTVGDISLYSLLFRTAAEVRIFLSVAACSCRGQAEDLQEWGFWNRSLFKQIAEPLASGYGDLKDPA